MQLYPGWTARQALFLAPNFHNKFCAIIIFIFFLSNLPILEPFYLLIFWIEMKKNFCSVTTVSAHLEPLGSIFQNGYLGGVQLKFGCVFIRICLFLLYFSTQNLVKHTLVCWVGLYLRVGFSMSWYGTLTLFNKQRF